MPTECTIPNSDQLARAPERRCVICGAPATFMGYYAVENNIDAWRHDCANGHSSLTVFTSELPAEVD
jgi:hypothetical protein